MRVFQVVKYVQRLLPGCLSAARGPEFDPVSYVDGLENPTENFANICGWLVANGFSDDEIRAVIGGNIYRALDVIWIS